MKFELSAKVTISMQTEVEADTLEEAIEIAKERDIEMYEYGHIQYNTKTWIADEFESGINRSPYDIKDIIEN